jgi:hypothetical protein
VRKYGWALALLSGCPGGDTGDPPALDWSVVREDDAAGAFLMAWGPSADDVWIVGGQPDAGVVLRGSGSEFAPLALPEGTPLLDWVHGSGADDVWVAGLHGTLLRWDGTGWTDHSLDVEEALWGLFARSPDDVWVVGGTSSFGGAEAVAARWDGTSVRRLTLPEEVGDVSNLFKVTWDGGRAWMCGTAGTVLTSGEGDELVAVPTGYAGDLVTVAARGDGEVLVVGGRGTGVVFEGDASGVTKTASAPAGLSGVAPTGGVAVVAGEYGFTGVYDPASDEIARVAPLTTDVLHGVFAFEEGPVYAVGGNLYTAGDSFTGTVLVAPAPGSP